jgi:hypothetical protein
MFRKCFSGWNSWTEPRALLSTIYSKQVRGV